MSPRAAVPVLAIALAASLALPRASGAGAWSIDRGQYFNAFEASVFSATSYRDQDGKRITIPEHFERRTLHWTGEVGWKKRVNLLLGASAASVSQATQFPSFGNFALPAQTGLATVELGLRWRLANGPRAAALEARWEAPAGYDRTTSWALGDGRQQLSGALLLGTPIGRHGFLDLSGGASYRFFSIHPSTDDRKDPLRTTLTQARASADLGWWLGRSLLLGGRYRGRMQIATNSDAAPSDVNSYGPIVLVGKEQLDRDLHVGGPMLLYRVDDRLDVIGGTWSVLSGKNTFHDDQFYVALAFKQTGLGRLQGLAGGTHP